MKFWKCKERRFRRYFHFLVRNYSFMEKTAVKSPKVGSGKQIIFWLNNWLNDVKFSNLREETTEISTVFSIFRCDFWLLRNLGQTTVEIEN